jgi:hypothetical protein
MTQTGHLRGALADATNHTIFDPKCDILLRARAFFDQLTLRPAIKKPDEPRSGYAHPSAYA